VRTRHLIGVVAVVTASGLLAAACGDDSSGSSATSAAATTAATTAAATTAGATTTAAATTTTAAGSGSTWCAKPIDTSIDKDDGVGAGKGKWILECAADKPLKAEGAPIVLGFQNPEGDPAGTFPEYQKGAKAAVDFVNNELGGIGADYKTGKPGRPIKLEVCVMAINPADSTKCANELAAKKPFAVLSTLNFFGNHFPIYQAAKIPVIVGNPITVADFTTDGVFAITSGCVGVHTGLVEFVTKDLGKKRVAVPWADTPPGVVCYHDLEKKPLRILAGKIEGPADAKGKVPGLEDIGVPIKPAAADVTPQAQQVLDFKPEGIIFSGQSADCWSLISALGKLGWKPSVTPIALSTACLDLARMKDAGDNAKGVYLVGGLPLSQPQLLEGLTKLESETYVAKMNSYGGKDDLVKGFAGAGFTNLMNIWRIASEHALAAGGTDKITSDSFVAYMREVANFHAFGAPPLDCKTAPSPYKSVCASKVTAVQFDGANFTVKRKNFSGLYIVKDTPIDTGK